MHGCCVGGGGGVVGVVVITPPWLAGPDLEGGQEPLQPARAN